MENLIYGCVEAAQYWWNDLTDNIKSKGYAASLKDDAFYFLPRKRHPAF